MMMMRSMHSNFNGFISFPLFSFFLHLLLPFIPSICFFTLRGCYFSYSILLEGVCGILGV
jgi:hypothetical protein